MSLQQNAAKGLANSMRFISTDGGFADANTELPSQFSLRLLMGV
jgi:hypothetical protein